MDIKLNQSTLPDSLPGFDLDEGLNRVGGDRNLYKKLLYAFHSDNRQVVLRIREALQQNDLVSAQKMVHAIKGLSGNLSANRLFKSAKELEQELKQGTQKNLDLQLGQFETSMNEVMESLRTLPDLEYRKAEDKSGAVPVDRESVTRTMKTLSSLLADFNMKAEESFQVLQKQMLQDEYKEEREKLEHAITNLEFDTASEILNALADKLNITI